MGVSLGEVERRYTNVREALERDGLDAALVCGSEYTGFEGAVTYLSGFQVVHRYAYVLLPREGEPAIVFPGEARYVGEHGTSWIEDQVFAERPGEWLADRLRGRRVGVYGLDYVMPVRDFAALERACELVSWDVAFDHARAVKSEEELESVRSLAAELVDERRKVAQLRRELTGGVACVTVRQVHPVGEEAEVDFRELWVWPDGVLTKVWLFVLRLSASGNPFHVAFASQAAEPSLSHALALQALGGVPPGGSATTICGRGRPDPAGP